LLRRPDCEFPASRGPPAEAGIKVKYRAGSDQDDVVVGRLRFCESHFAAAHLVQDFSRLRIGKRIGCLSKCNWGHSHSILARVIINFVVRVAAQEDVELRDHVAELLVVGAVRTKTAGELPENADGHVRISDLSLDGVEGPYWGSFP
jgi:hypothetical protein